MDISLHHLREHRLIFDAPPGGEAQPVTVTETIKEGGGVMQKGPERRAQDLTVAAGNYGQQVIQRLDELHKLNDAPLPQNDNVVNVFRLPTQPTAAPAPARETAAAKAAPGSMTLTGLQEVKPLSPTLSDPLGGGRDREHLTVSHTKVEGQPVPGGTATHETQIPMEQYVKIKAAERATQADAPKTRDLKAPPPANAEAAKAAAPGVNPEELFPDNNSPENQARREKLQTMLSQKDTIEAGAPDATEMPTPRQAPSPNQTLEAALRQSNPDAPALQPIDVAQNTTSSFKGPTVERPSQTPLPVEDQSGDNPESPITEQPAAPEAADQPPKGKEQVAASPDQKALDQAKEELSKALPSTALAQEIGQKLLKSITDPESARDVTKVAQHLLSMQGENANARRSMLLTRTKPPADPKDLDAWEALQRLKTKVVEGAKPGKEGDEKEDQLSLEDATKISRDAVKTIEQFNERMKQSNLNTNQKQMEKDILDAKLQMMGVDTGSISYDPPKAEALQGSKFDRGLNHFIGMILYFSLIFGKLKEAMKPKEQKEKEKKEQLLQEAKDRQARTGEKSLARVLTDMGNDRNRDATVFTDRAKLNLGAPSAQADLDKSKALLTESGMIMKLAEEMLAKEAHDAGTSLRDIRAQAAERKAGDKPQAAPGNPEGTPLSPELEAHVKTYAPELQPLIRDALQKTNGAERTNRIVELSLFKSLPTDVAVKALKDQSLSAQDMKNLIPFVQTANDSQMRLLMGLPVMQNSEQMAIRMVESGQVGKDFEKMSLEEKKNVLIALFGGEKPPSSTAKAPAAGPDKPPTYTTQKPQEAAANAGPEKAKEGTPAKPAEDTKAVTASIEGNLRGMVTRATPEEGKVVAPSTVLVREMGKGQYQVTFDTNVLLGKGVTQDAVDKLQTAMGMETKDTGSGIARSALMDEKGLREYATKMDDALATDVAQKIETDLRNGKTSTPEKPLASFLTFKRTPDGKYQISLNRTEAAKQGVSGDKLSAIEAKYHIQELNLKTNETTSKPMDTAAVQEFAKQLDNETRDKTKVAEEQARETEAAKARGPLKNLGLS